MQRRAQGSAPWRARRKQVQGQVNKRWQPWLVWHSGKEEGSHLDQRCADVPEPSVQRLERLTPHLLVVMPARQEEPLDEELPTETSPRGTTVDAHPTHERPPCLHVRALAERREKKLRLLRDEQERRLVPVVPATAPARIARHYGSNARLCGEAGQRKLVCVLEQAGRSWIK